MLHVRLGRVDCMGCSSQIRAVPRVSIDGPLERIHVVSDQFFRKVEKRQKISGKLQAICRRKREGDRCVRGSIIGLSCRLNDRTTASPAPAHARAAAWDRDSDSRLEPDQ